MGRKSSSVRTVAGSFYRRILNSKEGFDWYSWRFVTRSKLDDVSTTHFASQLATNKVKQKTMRTSEIKSRKRLPFEHFNSSVNKRLSLTPQKRNR